MQPQQITLPTTRTDARINSPLPKPKLPRGVSFLGALTVLVIALLSQQVPFALALLVALVLAFAAALFHRGIQRGAIPEWGGAFDVWVWQSTVSAAPAWQVFAHNLNRVWLSTPPPEGFEGKVRLTRIEASPAGWHLHCEGDGAKLKAATGEFAHRLGAAWLTVEAHTAQGIIWVFPDPCASQEVWEARRVLEAAGFSDASKGIVEVLHGTPAASRWTFTIESQALTLAMLIGAEDRLRSAVRFGYLAIVEIVPGIYWLDFQRSTPQTPLDQPLASPYQDR